VTEVRTSRVKAGVVLVACAALTGLFVWVAQSAGIAWVGATVFGLGVLAAGKQVFLPTTMFRLDDRGFAVVGGIRPRAPIAWDEVRTVETDRRGALRGASLVVTVGRKGGDCYRLELSDTWLDRSAETIGDEIARRANASRV
jgi:hypothetical protein